MSGPVVCVIPALDAAPSLPAVVAGLRAALPDARLVGIDDGSRDDTRAVLARLCDQAIVFPANRGKGAALRAGFEAALASDAGAVLTIDADGQHDPARAPALLEALAEADVVIGARARAGGPMPLRRRLTNALSARAVGRLAGRDVADAQSGFRAIRRAVLETVRGEGDRYEFETDFLIRAARAGFRLGFVPVPTLYGPRSHFRQLGDGARVVGTLVRHSLAAGWR